MQTQSYSLTVHWRRIEAGFLAGFLLVACQKNMQIAVADTEKEIQQLVHAAALCAADSSGNFPDSIDDLVKYKIITEKPRYLCRDGSYRDYIFIAGFSEVSPSDMVMVASPEGDQNGMRWIGTVGLRVKSLPAADVEKLIIRSQEYLRSIGAAKNN